MRITFVFKPTKMRLFEFCLICVLSTSLFRETRGQSSTTTTALSVARPFQAYLVGTFVTQTNLAVHYEIVRPALQLAVKEANRRFPEINFNLVVKNDTDFCPRNVAANLVAEEYYLRKAHAFIGPSCDLALYQVGRVASYWKVPVFSAGGIGVEFGNKAIYTTLTRLSFSLDRVSHFFVQIFKENDWHHVSIIVDETNPEMCLVLKSLKAIFKYEHEEKLYSLFVDIQTFEKETGNLTTKYANVLSEASKKARIIILLTSGTLLRDFLLAAYDLKMGNGEYGFFGVELIKNRQDTEDISWYQKGHRRNKEAKTMYESLMTVAVRVPISPGYSTFVYEVAKQAEENRQADTARGFTAADVNTMVAAFYDSVLIYGWALNRTLAEGGDPKDGVSLVRKVWGKTFYESLTGDIYINSNGDREADYTLNDLDPDTGIMRPVATYFGAKQLYKKMEGIEIYWPGGSKEAPPDVPFCGYTGKAIHCLIEEPFPVAASISIVMLVLLSVGGAVFYFLQKKLKLEADLADHWWKINYDDLKFPSQRNKTGASKKSATSLGVSRATSMVSSMNTTMDAISGVDCAVYNGLKVAVKNLNVKKIILDRHLMIQIKQMREVVHENLVKFYGLSLEEPNPCLVTELCIRGSLRDMLENDSINIDWMFRYAIMNDIIEGLLFLHNSVVQYHGHLKSTNLVIDGRFTVKICDYGLRDIYAQMKDTEEEVNPRVFFWTAPEHLRDAEPLRAGSKAGDIYSFAIILQEIITRQGPFEAQERIGKKRVTDEPHEILDRIRMGANPPYRPQINADEVTECPDLLTLVHNCWAENPNDRADASLVKTRLKRITKGVNSKNFLDNLLKRMEQYANNLENIVQEKTETLLAEKQKTDELVNQLLPKFVADELKKGHHVKPQSFDSVTVYFSDVIGFAALAAESGPNEVVDLLNDIYATIDGVIEMYDVYKVETIGDAYLVASGVPVPNDQDHAREIARMALKVRMAMKTFRARHQIDYKFEIRIGIHSGSCVAGVIGLRMPKYCLFGDTINTASRMETHGEPGKIHVSPQTKQLLDTFGTFIVVARGEVEIKGKGLIRTYWLEGEDVTTA